MQCSTKIEYTTDPYEACKDTNVIKTDLWINMGQKVNIERLKAFEGYQVTKKVSKLSADHFPISCSHFGSHLWGFE